MRYFTGTQVSNYLNPRNRAWDSVVMQSGTPVLDSEFNLDQDVGAERERLFRSATLASGFLTADQDTDYSYVTPSDPDWQENGFYLRKQLMNIAGFPLVLEYSNIDTSGTNWIQMGSPPVEGGSAPDIKRADFVFLEAWRSLITPSAYAYATITIVDPVDLTDGDTITVGAVTFTARNTPATPDEFLISTATNTAISLVLAINTDATYFAKESGNVVTVYASVPGTVGNSTVVSFTVANAGAILLNGVASSPDTMGSGTDAPNRPDAGSVYIHGNTDSSSTVAIAEDLMDSYLKMESSLRVQMQYRIRVVENVNFETEADGFSAGINAQGGESSPVSGYPFVPADGSTIAGYSRADLYGDVDAGLWIAGDGTGTSSAGLSSVDGFVYAIPICMVFRRNDASNVGGFDPTNNTNGGLPFPHASFNNWNGDTIGADLSDRPDGLFANQIASVDVLDLRKKPVADNLSAEVAKQIQSVMDGTNHTWAIDVGDKQTMGSGSGTISTYPIVCNEIGRSTANGGTGSSGDSTGRGVRVREFDHICRRFGSAPVAESVVFEIFPDASANPAGITVTKTNAGHTTWQEGDIIEVSFDLLDASTLANWTSASSSLPVSSCWPTGTSITGILSAIHDDGATGGTVPRNVTTAVSSISGNIVTLSLGPNTTMVDGGDPLATPYSMVEDSSTSLDNASPRRIFLEVEVSYPAGFGTSDTVSEYPVPDATVFPNGPILENDVSQRSPEMVSLPSSVRSGYREIYVEQESSDASSNPISDTVVSSDATTIVLPRRISDSVAAMGVLTVTDDTTSTPMAVASVSTGADRVITLSSPLPYPHTLCTVTYYALDPVPNYGAADGYQVSFYYRANASHALGSSNATILPSTLVVRPLVTDTSVYVGVTGKGYAGLPYPYESPMDQIAVNEGMGTFNGEWEFDSPIVGVSGFSTTAGLVTLHPMIPMDVTNNITLSVPDSDAEYRAFYSSAAASGYFPTTAAQNLDSTVNHKTWYAMLAKAEESTTFFRKGEVLLLVFSRAANDNSNLVSSSDDQTSITVFRTKNRLTMVN